MINIYSFPRSLAKKSLDSLNEFHKKGLPASRGKSRFEKFTQNLQNKTNRHSHKKEESSMNNQVPEFNKSPLDEKSANPAQRGHVVLPSIEPQTLFRPGKMNNAKSTNIKDNHSRPHQNGDSSFLFFIDHYKKGEKSRQGQTIDLVI